MPRNIAAENIKKEYEDFSYIVSHDLNAPIRHVREFTNLLLKSQENTFGEKEKEYVRFIESSLERLQKMQEALLTYSRISTKAEGFTKIDCGKIVADTLRAFQVDGANVSIKDFPVIYADEKQIRMMLFHLLDNAIKFVEEGAVSKIEITSEEMDDGCIFCIRDNGIGIPPLNHEDAFKIFWRYQVNGPYKGIGAGLAFVRKIVERHNGQIWIEPASDVGTCVYVSLPRGTEACEE